MAHSAQAQNVGNLVNAGVLGNSGAQGESLVKFGPSPAQGMGVAYDRFGFLWDRGGDGVLNRYAVDGRSVGQYPLPVSMDRRDQLTLVGDMLVVLVKGKLYTLPVAALPGTKPQAMNKDAELISFNSKDGTIAVYANGQFSLLNVSTGEIKPAGTITPPTMYSIELAPDGAIIAGYGGKSHRFFNGAETTTDGWPRAGLMGRFQYLAPYWYGHAFHGTIRRWDGELKPDPGVVLGGGSGSFIGHLDGDHEMSNGRGMAALGDGLFAISGIEGVMLLLRWHEDKSNFTIVRRLGALASCEGMAVDKDGNVRTELGYWKWNDGPDVALHDSGPTALAATATMTDGRSMLGVGVQNRGAARVLSGPFDDVRVAQVPGSTLAEKGIVGSAVLREKGNMLLILAANGQAQKIAAATRGVGTPAEPITITPATPVKKWSGLANGPAGTLIAAADGAVLELAKDGEGWKETRRWREWAGDQFGPRISIAVDGGNLWVSDTERHRVLEFDLKSGALLASFGVKDKAGTDAASLNLPTTIAAYGKRAAVYDSGNQRVVKLEVRG